MLNLNQITLFCVDTRTPDLSNWAIQKCLQYAKFNQVILVTNIKKLSSFPKNITVVEAPQINSIENYSTYLQSDLQDLIQGTHMLIIQWDSFIINPHLWSDDFYNFDYIGAPWPHHPETPIGNGGFSLRSKKLILAMQDPHYKKLHPEDQSICIFNRQRLENIFNIRYAPIELAQKFAFERTYHSAFGFHGFFNFAKVLNDAELRRIIIDIPSDLLGKLDTYDLYDDLYKQSRFNVAQLLLKKTSPKGNMWKKHVVRWINSVCMRWLNKY